MSQTPQQQPPVLQTQPPVTQPPAPQSKTTLFH